MNPQDSIGIHRNPYESIGIHGNPLESIGVHRNPYESIGLLYMYSKNIHKYTQAAATIFYGFLGIPMDS